MPTDATSNDIFSKICAELWLQLFLGNCSTAKFNYSLSHTHWHTHTYWQTYVRTCHVRWGAVARQPGRQANRDKAASRETSQMASHVSMANEVMCKSQWRRGRGQVPADWHSLPAQLSSAQLRSALLYSTLRYSMHRLSCSAPVHATKYCCHCVA